MGVLLSGRVYAADLCVELDGDVLTNVWRSVSVFVVPLLRTMPSRSIKSP